MFQNNTNFSFKLVRINPETEENLLYLKSLYDGPSPYELDFWQPPTRIGKIKVFFVLSFQFLGHVMFIKLKIKSMGFPTFDKIEDSS